MSSPSAPLKCPQCGGGDIDLTLSGLLGGVTHWCHGCTHVGTLDEFKNDKPKTETWRDRPPLL